MLSDIKKAPKQPKNQTEQKQQQNKTASVQFQY